MREIKFRAWDKKTKTMYQDIPLIMLSSHVKEKDEKLNKCLELFQSGSIGFELIQFTGLKDRNGKEIYEGDILEENMFVKWCDKTCGYALFLHKFNDDGSDYCLDCGGDIKWSDEVVGDMAYEVIGNIYENPELLNN